MKTPHWLKKAIFASQAVYCSDARNEILNALISDKFDKTSFDLWCRKTYNIKVDGKPDIATGYWDALEKCDKNFTPINIQRLINEAGL